MSVEPSRSDARSQPNRITLPYMSYATLPRNSVETQYRDMPLVCLLTLFVARFVSRSRSVCGHKCFFPKTIDFRVFRCV